MRRLRLTLSDVGSELAELKFEERFHNIAKPYRAKIQQHQGSSIPTSASVIDEEYISMARELAEAWVEIYLEEFNRENLIPSWSDMQEMEVGIHVIVEGISAEEFFCAHPAVTSRLGALPSQIFKRLQDQVRIIELESKRPKPVHTSPADIHINTTIHGDNLGSIMQGGQNNTQNMTHSDKSEVKTDEGNRSKN